MEDNPKEFLQNHNNNPDKKTIESAVIFKQLEMPH